LLNHIPGKEQPFLDAVSRHWKIAFLLALGFFHVILTLTILPAHLSIDEAIYHMMARDFPARGLEVFTGYPEYSSREMLHQFMRVYSGRTFSQYPYLFPVLTTPWYFLFGFYGLFLINSLAFAGVVLLVYLLARDLFGDSDLAANSCLVFVLGTYAWEYSQAAWPHMTALLFTTTAFYLAVRSYTSENTAHRLWLAVAAGLVAGFAPGIRLDAILVLGAILMIFLLSRPWRPRETVAVIVGSLPGFALLSWTNSIKFGTFNPLSYGTPIDGYVPTVPWVLAGAGLLGFILLWILTRTPVSRFLKQHWAYALGGVFMAAALALVIPHTRTMVGQISMGMLMMVVDLRFRDPGIIEQALRTTSSGAIVYIFGLKKSLIQSLPYLTALWIPAFRIFRGSSETRSLLMLFALPILLSAFFGFTRDHGGLCLNLRFFLAALPFTSILTAFALREISTEWSVPTGPMVWISAIGLGAAVFFLFVGRNVMDVEGLELPLLNLPLVLAGTLLILVVGGDLLKGSLGSFVRHTAFVILAISLTWASLTAFFYDYPLHSRQRAMNYEMGEKVLPLVPDDAVFFTAPFVDPFLKLVEKPRLRIGFPGRDRFADFPNIVEFYLKSHKRVFAAFPEGFWNELTRGPLSQFSINPLLSMPGCIVAEITRSTAD
jgi:hypothetical protein